MEKVKHIGERIRRIRESRDFKQGYVVACLNMSQQGYRKYETGESELTLGRFEAIATVLGMKMEDILTFDEKVIFNGHTKPNSNNSLVDNQAGMTEKDREIHELKLRLQEENIKTLQQQLDLRRGE